MINDEITKIKAHESRHKFAKINKFEINQIRLIECVYMNEERKNIICGECPDSGHCITVNPEMAKLIEKSKNEDGICEFTQEHFSFLMENYSETLVFDPEDCVGPTAMRDWIIESYYNTEIIPQIVSEDVISKIESDEYSDEELMLLYYALTKEYDQMLELCV